MRTKLAGWRGFAVVLAAMAVSAPATLAQLNIPIADGSDGTLIVNSSTNIDLSQAGSGSAANASAKSGFGTYDSNQWAVVFKYSSVYIAGGATVTFLNHPTHAPVIWLVSGNVTNNGTVNLDGNSGNNTGVALPEPGPGGFRGGDGGSFFGAGPGFGPGGGPNIPGADPPPSGTYTGTYGNPQIVPLIGGSGGAGVMATGGAGGGAILIAATGTISHTGSIHAQGGSGAGGAYGTLSASASGGGIRLVASQIIGNGSVLAGGGSAGRIRLECTNVSSLSLYTPNPTPTTLTLSPDATPVIFPPATSASVAIIAVVQSGLTNQAPGDPLAAMPLDGNDDVRIVATNNVTIQLRTRNFPLNGTVAVYLKPLSGIINNNSPLSATFDSGTTNLAYWHVTTTLPYPAHTVMQARAFY